MISVLLVDDESLFRKGLDLLLREFHIRVMAEAENGRQAVTMLNNIKPDVVLLDLDMPELNGSETLNIITQKYPQLKVIILSSYFDEQVILDHFNRGAKAYVSKNENIYSIVNAITKVHQQGIFKDNISKLLKTKVPKDRHYYKLRFTNKELEIIHFLCSATSVKIISGKMNISQKTIETHITEIYKKLNVKNRMEFMRHALKEGFEFLRKS